MVSYSSYWILTTGINLRADGSLEWDPCVTCLKFQQSQFPADVATCESTFTHWLRTEIFPLILGGGCWWVPELSSLREIVSTANPAECLNWYVGQRNLDLPSAAHHLTLVFSAANFRAVVEILVFR